LPPIIHSLIVRTSSETFLQWFGVVDDEAVLGTARKAAIILIEANKEKLIALLNNLHCRHLLLKRGNGVMQQCSI
jgi:hypothetical protein